MWMPARAPHLCPVPVAPPQTGTTWECPHCFTRWLWSHRPPCGKGYVRLRDTIETLARRDRADMARFRRRLLAWGALGVLVWIAIAVAVIVWATR